MSERTTPTGQLIKLVLDTKHQGLTTNEIRLLGLFGLSNEVETARTVMGRIEALEAMQAAIRAAMEHNGFAHQLCQRALAS